MDDPAWKLREVVYRSFARTGRPPARGELDASTGDPAATARLLAELHDRHAIVLDDDGTIRMALPFSAVETDHVVTAGDRSWYANCAWDALAIPTALGIDATIDAPWHDTGEPVDLAIVGGTPSSTDGWVHFAVPARHWWDDIVET